MRKTDNGYWEEQIFLAAEPHIRKLCAGRWFNLEPEDRFAEATFFFIWALRGLPKNTGRFMKDFEALLIPYMEQKNREATSRFYRDLSMDALLPASNGEGQWSWYDTIAGPAFDKSSVAVDQFLISLPELHCMIMGDLFYRGLSKAETARKHNMTPYALTCVLRKIGNEYQRDQHIEKIGRKTVVFIAIFLPHFLCAA